MSVRCQPSNRLAPSYFAWKSTTLRGKVVLSKHLGIQCMSHVRVDLNSLGAPLAQQDLTEELIDGCCPDFFRLRCALYSWLLLRSYRCLPCPYVAIPRNHVVIHFWALDPSPSLFRLKHILRNHYTGRCIEPEDVRRALLAQGKGDASPRRTL